MLSVSRFTDIFRRLDLYHLNIVVSLLAPVQITWDLPNFYILSRHTSLKSAADLQHIIIVYCVTAK